MSDLISRKALIEAIDTKCNRYFNSIGITDYDYEKADEQSRWISDGVAMAVDAILDLPTAERVGKWIERRCIAVRDRYECSACKRMTVVEECMGKPLYAFCPWCGARMLEGEEG